MGCVRACVQVTVVVEGDSSSDTNATINTLRDGLALLLAPATPQHLSVATTPSHAAAAALCMRISGNTGTELASVLSGRTGRTNSSGESAGQGGACSDLPL